MPRAARSDERSVARGTSERASREGGDEERVNLTLSIRGRALLRLHLNVSRAAFVRTIAVVLAVGAAFVKLLLLDHP
jgi:hypothetical protein